MRNLSKLLIAVLPFGALAPACTSSSNDASTAQMITCTTDPGTGVILSCVPGGGDGGANTCNDVDEDGDGDPHDEGEDEADDQTPDDSGHHDGFTAAPKDGSDDGVTDGDGDGVDDDHDCDDHPGEDGNRGELDLPYDVRPALGSTTTPVADAFAAEGGQPTAIISVTGATWRAAELSAGTAFVVTAADCSHAGNRDVGRDRVIVTWANADGSTQSDHLDIRYCK